METVVNGNHGVIETFDAAAVMPDGRHIIVSDASSAALHMFRMPFEDDSLVETYGQPGSRGHVDGPSGSALFARPLGVAVDASGNIFVADRSRIRMIAAADGRVSTVAGTGTTGARDGPGDEATFSDVQGLLLLPEACSLLVMDKGDRRIRNVSGSFLCQGNPLPPAGARSGSSGIWELLLAAVAGALVGAACQWAFAGCGQEREAPSLMPDALRQVSSLCALLGTRTVAFVRLLYNTSVPGRADCHSTAVTPQAGRAEGATSGETPHRISVEAEEDSGRMGGDVICDVPPPAAGRSELDILLLYNQDPEHGTEGSSSAPTEAPSEPGGVQQAHFLQGTTSTADLWKEVGSMRDSRRESGSGGGS